MEIQPTSNSTDPNDNNTTVDDSSNSTQPSSTDPPPLSILQTDTLNGIDLNAFRGVLVQTQINLPPGHISIADFQGIINEAINNFRDAIRNKELTDYDLAKLLHDELARSAYAIFARRQEISDQVSTWNTRIEQINTDVEAEFEALQEAFNEYNNFMEATRIRDREEIDKLNQIYKDYKQLKPPPPPFDEEQKLKDFNDGIDAFNAYAEGRNADVEAAIQDLQDAIASYNNVIEAANAEIDAIDAERESLGLTTKLDHFDLAVVDEEDFNPPKFLYRELPLQDNFESLYTEDPQELQRPNNSNDGRVQPTPEPDNLPQLEEVSLNEVLTEAWVPSALETLAAISLALDLLDMSVEEIFGTTSAANLFGTNLTTVNGLLSKVSPVFLAAGFGLVGGIGLAGSAIGLQTRNLEKILSSGIYRAVSQNLSMPITGRLFARLQFSTLELLALSALLSSDPTMRMLAASLGTLDATSPVVSSIIALAIATQILALVNSDVPNALVNGQIVGLGFFSRTTHEDALDAFSDAETAFLQAQKGGNQEAIDAAFENLVAAALHLSDTAILLSLFGESSLGELGGGADKVTAALNLSLLSLSLAELGHSLGIPDLVTQVFGQLSQLSSDDLLAALSSPTGITDILDNPVSMASIKQMLTDTLIQNGVDPDKAAQMINNALNGVILGGNGLNTFSQLHSLLVDQFTQAGFDLLTANALANYAAALIGGELGAFYLNAVFNLNSDPSEIGPAISNHLFAIDSGLVNSILKGVDIEGSGAEGLSLALTGAIDRALAGGPFENQREFRDAVLKELRDAGFDDQAAVFLANGVALYGINGSLLSPFGTQDLSSPLTDALTAAGIEGAGAIVDAAVARTHGRGPFSSDDEYRNALREEVHRGVLDATEREDGNALFDSAIASLADPSQLLGLAAFIELLSSQVQGLLSGELGSRLGREITDTILDTLLGGTNAEEIEERSNPLSILNQIEDQIDELADEEDREYMRDLVGHLKDLLEALTTPNAEVSYILRRLGDNPGTFFRAVSSGLGSRSYQHLQIPS